MRKILEVNYQLLKNLKIRIKPDILCIIQQTPLIISDLNLDSCNASLVVGSLNNVESLIIRSIYAAI